MNEFIALMVTNLVPPKAVAKHELLFNKLASRVFLPYLPLFSFEAVSTHPEVYYKHYRFVICRKWTDFLVN